MRLIYRLAVRALLAAALVLAATVAAVMVRSNANLDAHGDGRSLARPVDAILVLGGGLEGDGWPAYSSRRRVKLAVDLMMAGKARALILSGANRSPAGPASAAEIMRDYAVSLGAPAEALLVEDDAHSTFENLRFGFAMANAHGFRRVAILSDAFHLERARWLAAYFGQPDTGLVAADGLRYDAWPDRAWNIVREAMAWWYNLGKTAGWEALAAAGYDPEERRDFIR